MKSKTNELVQAALEIIGIANNGKKNLIFGTGWMGDKVYEAFLALNISVYGFVVSKTKNVSDFFHKIPVFSKSFVLEEPNEYNIFIALRDQETDLLDEFKMHFKNVKAISYPKDLCVISAKYYIDYLISKKVDIEQEILNINGINIINPFLKPYDYLLSWLYEAGDLILPVIYQDYGRIDEGSYEEKQVSLKKDDVVIDCGANIGLFSSVAAHKGCKVYAFEPVPNAILYLQEVKKLYQDKIEICPYALSNKTGTAIFNIQNNDLLGASLLTNNNKIDTKLEVQVTTIDEFVKVKQIEKVDYIKADIEGAERDMLVGAKETIKKFKPKISICTYHLEDDKEVLEQIIRTIEPDYHIFHKWKKLYAYIPENV